MMKLNLGIIGGMGVQPAGLFYIRRCECSVGRGRE